MSAPYLSPREFAPFAIIQQSHGYIPNFFRAQTLCPDLLEAGLDAAGTILLPEDVLTRIQKECILLVVSAANLNSYCVAVHCNMLRGLGMPPEEGDQIAIDHRQSGLSEADRTLLDFAVKLGTRASEFSRGDVTKLQTLGFTDHQILECEVVTALNNFANTLQLGLGVEPDFEPPPVFDPAEAQDAMQDALISAFRHIGGFQGRSKFSTWLVSIARNTALEHLRCRKDMESLDDDGYGEDENFRPRQVRAWEDNPEQCYSNAETRQLIERGILELPTKYREVVMLRDIQQLTTDETARQLGLSVPTVKVRLLRARLMLREWLSPYFTTSSPRRAA